MNFTGKSAAGSPYLYKYEEERRDSYVQKLHSPHNPDAHIELKYIFLGTPGSFVENTLRPVPKLYNTDITEQDMTP